MVPDRHRLLAMAAAAVALTVWNGAARADSGWREAPVPLLLPLEPITVPIVDHGELLGRMEVRAMWQESGEAPDPALQARLPLLRSALVEAAAEHARLIAAPGRPIDPASLSTSLETRARAAGFSGELLVLEASARSG